MTDLRATLKAAGISDDIVAKIEAKYAADRDKDIAEFGTLADDYLDQKLRAHAVIFSPVTKGRRELADFYLRETRWSVERILAVLANAPRLDQVLPN